MKLLLLSISLLLLVGCAILPDVADLENALPPPEAYESAPIVPEFVQ